MKVVNNVVNRTPASVERKVMELLKKGVSGRQIGHDLEIDESTVRRIKASYVKEAAASEVSASKQIEYLDKKKGGISWRDVIPAVENLQKLRKSASWSQTTAQIKVGNGKSPIAVFCFGDQHIGAISTDYTLFREMTDLIINTPNLYAALMGDETEMAIKLRSVAEVCAQILDPFMQAEFLESWLNDISHKVLFSTWSNHSTEREEKASGQSIIKSILAHKVPFFSGIGHPDLIVGKETYKLAVNHKFAGVTLQDSTAGCKRYLRQEYPEGEIAIQGDCHRTGVSIYNEGGSKRIAISSGTLNVHSGYAERYFSLKTSTAFPVVVLRHDKHQATPYFSIQEYLDSLT